MNEERKSAKIRTAYAFILVAVQFNADFAHASGTHLRNSTEILKLAKQPIIFFDSARRFVLCWKLLLLFRVMLVVLVVA